MNSFFLNTTESLLSSDDNITFLLSSGNLSEPKMSIAGNNNILTLYSVISLSSYKEFISIWGQNNTILIQDSHFADIHQIAFVLYPECSSNRINIFNTTFEIIHFAFLYSFVTSHSVNNYNNIELNLSVFTKSPSWSDGLIHSWRYLNISINNCLFLQNYFDYVGLIMVYDDFNSITFFNCNFNLIHSFGEGAIYSTCCWNLLNNTLNINACFFSNTSSELFGNIYAGATKITILNSSFIDMKSFVGTFIYAIGANIEISNCTIQLSTTGMMGNLYLIGCVLEMNNTTFLDILGDESSFIFATDSNISLTKNYFGNFNFSESFILLKIENKLSISNCSFLNFTEGIIFFLTDQNTINVSQSNFSNMYFLQNGILLCISNNTVLMQNIIMANMKSGTLGALLESKYGNSFTFTNLIAFNISTRFSALCVISTGGILNIFKSQFWNCSSQGTGGIIFSSFAKIDIQNCKFLRSSANMGGVIYSTNSKFTINASIFSESKANYWASVIYAEETSIYMNFTKFDSDGMLLSQQKIDSSVIYLKTDNLNSIFLETISFTQEGSNTNHVIYIEGEATLYMKMLSFKNNKGDSLVKIQDALIEINFLEFVNNQVNGCLELNTNDENLIIQNVIFNSNSFVTFLMEIDNSEGESMNSKFSINNIFFENNMNDETSGAFIEIIGINEGMITNLSCLNNLERANAQSDIAILNLLNCAMIFLNNSIIVKNFAQILTSQNSFIYLTHLFSNNDLNYLFIQLINSEIIIESTLIDLNYAFNGEFVFSLLTSINSNISLIGTVFSNAEGQMIDQSPHNSLDISEGDSVLIVNCSIFDQYSFLTINSNNFIIIINTNFNSQNGGLFFSNVNKVLIDNTNFSSLGLLANYSAINILTDTDVQMLILLSNCQFTENNGALGAAIFVQGFTNVIMFQNQFINNVGLSMGASFYSRCVGTFQCLLTINKTLFKNNWADLGGSIFLEKLHVFQLSKAKFSNDSFLSPYLRKNFVMTAPYFVNLTTIIDEYGNEIDLGIDDQDKIVEINNGQTISLLFDINDSTNRICSYDDGSLLVISKDPQDSTIQTIKGGVAYSSGGQFQLSNFYILAESNGTYNLSLQMSGLFSITQNLYVHIRACKAGEYYDVGYQSCFQCPLYTYSLILPMYKGSMQEGLISCIPCPENSLCQGSTIVPKVNYWKSEDPNSTLILKCPSDACIPVDLSSFDGFVPCEAGHQGALCIVCETGYSKESFSGSCDQCEISLQFFSMMILKLGFTLVFVSYQVYTKLFVSSLNAVKLKTVYLKIIRDHFNQIFLIFSISGTDFDDFFSFINNNGNLFVTGSTLNLNCFVNDRIDMFFFFIFSIILSPLYLQAFISLAFFIIYLEKIISGKKVFFSVFLKTLFTLFIVVCDTQYTLILGAFFKLFQCTQLDNNDMRTFLEYAPHIECYSGEHIFYLCVLGIPCLIIWVLALPLIFFLLLLRMKITQGLKRSSKNLCVYKPERSSRLQIIYADEINTMPTIKNFDQKKNIGMFEINIDSTYMLAFLYSDYEGSMYYWSSIIMIWKIIMSVLVAFVPTDYAYIALFIFYILLIFIYQAKKPYKHKSSMFLVRFSFFSNMMTVLVAMLDKKTNYYYNNFETSFYLAIQILFFIYAGALFILQIELNTYLEKFANYLMGKKNNKLAKNIAIKLMTWKGKRKLNKSLNIITPSSNPLGSTSTNINFEWKHRDSLPIFDHENEFDNNEDKKNSIPEFEPQSTDLMKLNSKFEIKSFAQFKSRSSILFERKSSVNRAIDKK